jgi:hypothetical protein
VARDAWENGTEAGRHRPLAGEIAAGMFCLVPWQREDRAPARPVACRRLRERAPELARHAEAWRTARKAQRDRLEHRHAAQGSPGETSQEVVHAGLRSK